jgi:hypothetical protein
VKAAIIVIRTLVDYSFGLKNRHQQVHMVRENLRIAQSRQKSYADHKRRELSFQAGDYLYLKVSPMRGLQYFKV